MAKANLLLLSLSSGISYASNTMGDLATTSQVWRTFLGLAVVLALVPLSLWGIKKLQSAQLRLHRSDINVIAVQSLGTKEKLVLVEVEGKRSLLGVTANSINKLQDYPEKEGSFRSEMSKAENDIKNEA
ncbi:flagellar biosynthetic protein FliO [Marinomonas mediterranea]|jgi:flagellar biosynthetic protein FliO|uniref:Flagellar protein n=1 Tax=Marinomonas mediterranea (strain ATCC 700492 / JCM 21426 / NBRC 103028 / MMB-1) TaxID=717774 RepID=F2K3K1_MARM1|nr:flagellar biosynthetic protein FliO [Marinomonas mediterranea]ADZ92440.1 flagellar biosynthetic protein FliO [Marinomonas mediterranea MMB-1]WCN10392.1 flagellar biosynthetic protein FliO [Marinomonas mediterranea]WCN14438.1 flagellar biosynthetic protein FliO [Marinomonas mediterranea]WCN18490.1 flagellar biosynthetic protein FliO [Marinomonas mediterranea MMB-1]